MNVDFMRRVDFWIGVPLCCFCSLVFLAGRSLRKALGHLLPGVICEKQSSFEVGDRPHVLLIELSEMGSAILVDPMMRTLRDRGAELYFVIFRQNAISLSLLKTVKEENIFKINAHGFINLVGSTVQFLFWCRQKRISIVIDLELFSRFTSLLTLFCGAQTRVGFSAYTAEGLYRGTRVLTHPVYYNPYLHITQNFLALARSLFSPVARERPLLKEQINIEEIIPAKANVTGEQLARVSATFAREFPATDGTGNLKTTPWILLNTIGGDFLPQRRWPKEHFVELAQIILGRLPHARILFTGAVAERAQIEVIAQAVGDPRAKNFAGLIEFGDLPALYQLSTLMLTNDSGPAHFASTTDLPTYVLFGPETPRLYGALGKHFYPLYLGLACSPCVSATNHRKTVCQNNICLKEISPAFVFRELEKTLGPL